MIVAKPSDLIHLKEIERLERELAEALNAKDAARYRWLRQNIDKAGEELLWKDDEQQYAAEYVTAEELDFRIDAAMQGG